MQIQKIIDERAMTPAQVLVVMLCFVLNMIDGMDVVVASYVAPRIIEEWSVSSQTFGLVFSSALVGMASGAMFISPYTDVIGRRNMVLFCIVIVSVGMLLTAWVNSVPQLALLRFFTGLGIGSMLASLTSLVYEYSPARRRNFAVSFVLSGYPVGATLTGLMAAWIIPEYGWRSMFYAGATVSLVMLPVALVFMPESLEFLLHKQPARALERANAILSKLRIDRLTALPARSVSGQPASGGDSLAGNIKSLITKDRFAFTMRLWIAFFMAFFTLYFLLSWIPKISEGTGLTPAQGSYAGAVFNLGSFFGIVCLGYISTWFGLKRMIFIFLILSAVLMVVFGVFRFGLVMYMTVLFVLGFFVQGGFVGLYSVAARLYPVEIRTTGVGWGIGLGRFGAILAPTLGGIAIGMQLPVALVFIVFALPFIIAAFAETGIKSTNID